MEVWLTGPDGKPDHAGTGPPVGFAYEAFARIFHADGAQGRLGWFSRLGDFYRDARFGASEVDGLLRDLRRRREELAAARSLHGSLDALIDLVERAVDADRGLALEAD